MDIETIELSEEASIENLAEENGIRFWYADKLSEFLGYSSFDSFKSVIRKARASSEQLGLETDDEFIQTEINGNRTYKLTRFACLLCTLYADESKPMVAKAKVSLAKFADVALQAYELERIDERQKLTHGENFMEDVAKEHGLAKDSFAIFKSAGYRGMYNMNVKQLRQYKGLKPSHTLYDFMGITELAANTFRVTQTAESIKSKNTRTTEGMVDTANNVGKQVRQMVVNNTNKKPEDLQIEPKISETKSRIKKVRTQMIKHDKNN